MAQVNLLNRFIPNVISSSPVAEEQPVFELIEDEVAPPATPQVAAGQPVFEEIFEDVEGDVQTAPEGIGGFFGPLGRGVNRIISEDAASFLENFGAREIGKQLVKEGQERDFARATGKYAKPMRSIIDDPFGFLDDALDLKRVWQATGENVPLMGAIAVTGLLTGGAALAITKSPSAAMWAGRAGAGLLYGLLERGSFIKEANDYEEQTGQKIDPWLKHSVGTVVGAFNGLLGLKGLDSVISTVAIPGLKGRLLHALLAGGAEGITEMSEELTQALGSGTYRGIPWRDTLIQMQEALYAGLVSGTGASVALAPFGGKRKATDDSPPPPELTADQVVTAEGEARAREQEQIKALEEMTKPINKAGEEAVAKVREVTDAVKAAPSEQQLALFEEVTAETTPDITVSSKAASYLTKARVEYRLKPVIRNLFDSPEDLAESWAEADELTARELARRAANEQSSLQNETNLPPVQEAAPVPAPEAPPAQLTTKQPPRKRGRPEARTYNKVADELEARMDAVVKEGGDVRTDPVYQQLAAEADALLDADFKRRVAAKVALDNKPEEQAVQDIVQARTSNLRLSVAEQLEALDDKITANHTHLKEVDLHLKELNDAAKLTTPISTALGKIWDTAEEGKLTAELEKRLNKVNEHFIALVNMLGEARRRVEAEQAKAEILTPPKSVGRELSAYDKIVTDAEKQAGRKLTKYELEVLATQLLTEEPTALKQIKDVEPTADDIADIEKAIAEGKVQLQVGSAQLDPVAQKAQEIFGVTEDIDKAGYITADGKMIDLSQGAKHKTLHHGAVKKAYNAAGVDPLGRAREVFIANGNVRVTFSEYDWGLIDLKNEPNIRQYARIKSLLEQAYARNQRVDIEMQRGDEATVIETTPADDVQSTFNKIKMFYAGTRDMSLLNFLQEQAQAIQRAERQILTEAEQAPQVQRLKRLFPFLKFGDAALPAIASKNQQLYGANIDHTIYWVADGARDDTLPHEAFHDLLLLLLANNDAVAFKGLELAGSVEQLVQWTGEEYAKRYTGEIASPSTRTARLRQWLNEFWLRIKELFLNARLTQKDIRNILGEAFFKGNILERVGLNVADVTHEDLYTADYALGELIANDPDSMERRQAINEIANAQDPALRSLDGIARQLDIPVNEIRKAQFQVGKRQVMENNEGFRLVETLSDGKAIYDQVSPDDISPFAATFGSPEYQALRGGFMRAADLLGNLIERSLLHMFQHRQDVAGFDMFRRGKGKVANPEQLRDAVQKTYDHKAEQIADINLRLAARAFVTYFKEIKDAYIKSRLEILRYKTKATDKEWLVTALERLEEGAQPSELLEELGITNKNNIKTLAALYRRLTDIRNWGIDKFITNIEPGRFAVVDFTGSVIAVSETHEGAVKLAKEFLSQPGELIEEVRDANGNIKLVKTPFEELNVAISTDIRPPSPDKIRLNALKGRDNLLEVIDVYSARMRKAIALDPIAEQIKYEMGKYPKEFPQHVAEMVQRTMHDARGNYWRGDQILDAFLDKRLPKLSAKINKKGMAYTRLITSARAMMANVKLGYRAIAPIINFLGGTFQHTFVKTGALKLIQAASFLRTAEGKQLIKEEEIYLGRGRIVEEMKYAYEKVQLWKPLGAYQSIEKINVELSYAANYLMAREIKNSDGSMFTDAAAREFARRAVRFQQFMYNIAAIPAILRSPTGRLVGQFKTYFVKEIEFISSLRRAEIPRYMAATFMISGLRGVSYAIKTLPFIWLLGGLLDEGDKWLNSMPKEAGWFARTMLAFAQRGVPGALGGDITAPAVIQLPDKPEELLGPFIGDVIALFRDVIKPVFKGEGYSLQDLGQLAKYRVPALNYYWQLMDTFFKEGKIFDQNGKPLYTASNWDRFLLGLGVTPADKSREDAVARLLKDEEATRRARVMKAQNAFFAHVFKRRSVGDVISWLSSDSFNDVVADLVAAGAVESLEANAQFRFLNRREQEIIRARLLRRPDVIRMWPNPQFMP